MLDLLNQLALSFDLPILDWIQANLKNGIFDVIWPIITLFGDGGIFWIGVAVVLLVFPKTRKTGIGMGIALFMGVIVCNVTLKPLVGRIRPYDFKEQLGVTIPLLADRLHDFSFPSGHTIASFEASVVIFRNYKKAGIAAIILAFLIAFSRLYMYYHYPTDVLFSMVVGTIFAIIGDKLAGVIVKKLPHGKYENLE